MVNVSYNSDTINKLHFLDPKRKEIWSPSNISLGPSYKLYCSESRLNC